MKEKKETIRFFRIFPWKFLKNNIQLIFKLLILNGFTVFLLIEIICKYALKE